MGFWCHSREAWLPSLVDGREGEDVASGAGLPAALDLRLTLRLGHAPTLEDRDDPPGRDGLPAALGRHLEKRGEGLLHPSCLASIARPVTTESAIETERRERVALPGQRHELRRVV